MTGNSYEFFFFHVANGLSFCVCFLKSDNGRKFHFILFFFFQCEIRRLFFFFFYTQGRWEPETSVIISLPSHYFRDTNLSWMAFGKKTDWDSDQTWRLNSTEFVSFVFLFSFDVAVEIIFTWHTSRFAEWYRIGVERRLKVLTRFSTTSDF